MKRRFFYGALLVVLGLNLLVGAQIYFSNLQAAERDESYPNLRLFSIVLDRVRKDYVDGADLTYQDLIHGALKGMLSTLDPHSEFMEPLKYEDLKEDTQGEFGGVGIVISLKDDYVTVVAPMDGTPGFEAGILSGDRIVRINGSNSEKFSLQDAVEQLRGKPGTQVSLTIYRPSDGELRTYTLTRAQIKVTTVKDIRGVQEFPVLESQIGYIRIAQFGEHTSDDLESALTKLERQQMKGLILDLRGNPGGLLDQAVRVCEKFLPRGQLVVSTEGRDAKEKREYSARGRDNRAGLPMVILVNNGSASASEIVAGCLQDTTRMGKTKALVVGMQTFGKGSVQSILPLPDGSALRLTTAKYYTPSHKVIHEVGITPDSLVPMTEEQERDMQLQRSPGGIESLPEADRERVRVARDPQMDRAMDVLKGMLLYTEALVPGGRTVENVATR